MRTITKTYIRKKPLTTLDLNFFVPISAPSTGSTKYGYTIAFKVCGFGLCQDFADYTTVQF